MPDGWSNWDRVMKTEWSQAWFPVSGVCWRWVRVSARDTQPSEGDALMCRWWCRDLITWWILLLCHLSTKWVSTSAHSSPSVGCRRLLRWAYLSGWEWVLSNDLQISELITRQVIMTSGEMRRLQSFSKKCIHEGLPAGLLILTSVTNPGRAQLSFISPHTYFRPGLDQPRRSKD